jgi:Tfp pilus assembly protein PilN
MQTVAEATAVMDERQHLLSALDPLAVLSSRERAVGTVGAAMILSDVTTRIPQDAWLTTFELKGHNLRLAGLSPDPAAVVKVLSESPRLTAVELRSSMTAGAGSGKDRFEVVAQVKDGA